MSNSSWTDSPLKIGYLTDGTNGMVTQSGELSGFGGIYQKEKRIFPPNSIFVEFAYSKYKSVEEALLYHMDYINELPMLNELPPNITSGPPYEDTSCHLIKPAIVEHRNELLTIQDSLRIFETRVVMAICMMMMTLIVLLMRFSNKSPVKTSWNTLKIFFHGDIGSAKKSISLRILLLFILLWFFLMKTIHSGFVSTGFIEMETAKDINSFRDMIEKNIGLGVWFRQGFCDAWLEKALQTSPEMNQTFHSLKRHRIRPQAMYFEDNLENLHDTAFIFSKKEAGMIRFSRCQKFKNSPDSIHSTDPFTSQLQVLFYRQSMGKKKQKRLNNWAQTNLEFGFRLVETWHYRKMTEQKQIEMGLKQRLDTSCLEKTPVEISFHELQIEFLVKFFLAILFIDDSFVPRILD